MKQFALIGLGNFGIRMLEELEELNAEILVIDKDRDIVDKYKNRVAAAYIADVINEEAIRKTVPVTVDAAIVDLGGKVEASVLVTNYLKKMGVREIIAKADTDEHGEILDIVGATQVIFPNREAAKRITPLLVSEYLFNFLPLSHGLVVAEVRVQERYYEKTLMEANVRKEFGVNVIAIRKSEEREYNLFIPEYRLQPDDVLLVAGQEHDVERFSGSVLPDRGKNGGNFFSSLFPKQPKPDGE